MVTKIVVFCLKISLLSAHLNNACNDWDDYHWMYFSENCHYNPDAGKDVGEIIERLIGVSEFHEVTTEDGYILGIFRMPKENPRGVVLLQHPVTVDAKIWLVQENISTALLFWNAGYDVWMPNNRGTTYSQKHVNLTTVDKEFWDFSFHEMGVYDQPATIAYIKNQTNVSQVIYIGHSMGTTSSLIYSSLKPEEAKRDVKVFVEMSPAAFFQYTPSLLKPVATLFPLLKAILDYLQIWSVLAYDVFYMTILRFFIAFVLPFKKLIPLAFPLFTGGSVDEWDPKIINNLVIQFGSETSVKSLEHYSQNYFNNGQFRQFDYGISKNLELYGNENPPNYPLKNITAPIYLIYSSADILTDFKDVEYLYEQLPDVATSTYGKLKVDLLGHIGFHSGLHRNTLVYDPLIAFLNSIKLSI